MGRALVGVAFTVAATLVGCGSSDETPGKSADAGTVSGWEDAGKSRLIFMAAGSGPSPDVFLLDQSGSITTLVDDALPRGNPSIAPSGLEVAFHRQMGAGFGSNEIFTRNVATGQETRVTDDAVADVAPKWSADGTRLVFSSWSDGGAPSMAANIFIVDSNGKRVQLTHDTDRENLDPAWCGPDQIVFKSSELAPNDCKEQIQVIALDGSGRRQLSAPTGFESDHDPRCTPDGATAFFYRYEAKRCWKDLTDVATLSQHWRDFYPVNVWAVSTSATPGSEQRRTDCEHSCPYPVPAENGVIGFLHQDFITDANDALVGSTTHFQTMRADDGALSDLLPPASYAAYAPTLQYWDW